jgi:hypothetical protein
LASIETPKLLTLVIKKIGSIFAPHYKISIFLTKQNFIMDKLQISEILVKGAKLEAVKLNEKNVAQLIDETKQKQAEVLKLKEVDQESLKMVVQL